MSTYSVTESQNCLPDLIDRALGGEIVMIARDGQPVVALTPTVGPASTASTATSEWLRDRRRAWW